MLEAAVVGLGVGEKHAAAFARTAGARLRWVYDIDAGRMDRVISAIGSGRPAESFEQILSDPETSIVSIASYDQDHAEQARRALSQGKHVFCEKPLCRTHEELMAIKRAWQASGRALACNLVLRAAPLYRWLREVIRAGELGRIYAFDGDYLYGRIHKLIDGWRGEVEDYSAMLGGGVHMVDLMLWLTGERPAAVTAVGNRIATEGTRFRYNDYVAAVFHYSSGMIGRISANLGCVHSHQHVLRVFGTKGTFLYDDQGPRIHKSSSAPSEAIGRAPLPETKGDLIPDFVDAILRGDFESRTQHELDVVAACQAVDRAIAVRKEVGIDYV